MAEELDAEADKIRRGRCGPVVTPLIATLEDPRAENIRISGQDVREREIRVLQREIAGLESVLTRVRARGI